MPTELIEAVAEQLAQRAPKDLKGLRDLAARCVDAEEVDPARIATALDGLGCDAEELSEAMAIVEQRRAWRKLHDELPARKAALHAALAHLRDSEEAARMAREAIEARHLALVREAKARIPDLEREVREAELARTELTGRTCPTELKQRWQELVEQRMRARQRRERCAKNLTDATAFVAAQERYVEDCHEGRVTLERGQRDATRAELVEDALKRVARAKSRLVEFEAELAQLDQEIGEINGELDTVKAARLEP